MRTIKIKKLLDSQEKLTFWNYFLGKLLEVTLLFPFILREIYFDVSKSWKSLFFGGGGCFPGSIPHSPQSWPILNYTFIMKISKGLYITFLLQKILPHFPPSTPRASLKWNYFKFAFTCFPQVALNKTFFFF